MTDLSNFGDLGRDERSHWIRLRTLTSLRWVAIIGQTIAIVVAELWFGLQMPLGLCFLVVSLAVIANLLVLFIFPINKRLRETETMLMLLFDAAQLALLLAIAGGLNNPFALLLLTPVTISATALRLKPTLLLGVFTLLMATILLNYHIPLIDAQGAVQQLPDIFRFGFWIAILIGVAFLAFFAWRITDEMNLMSEALIATQMALAREQKLTDLGGVVAAAAHELGTPLATIKLVSAELLEEVADNEVLRDDVALVLEQADRCGRILRSMGRAGKDDPRMHAAPFANVVSEAAEPHQDRGKTVHLSLVPLSPDDSQEPLVRRRPELIHGVRNLVQNAVDFAQTSVWIEAFWSEDRIGLRIMDDGAGYPPHIIGRIGDPFVRRRKSDRQARPGYEGMGLGLFIAKTLLERTGAELSFANGSDPHEQNPLINLHRGAIVQVTWPRSAVEAPPGTETRELTPN